MGKSVAQKILEIHIIEGEYKYGSEIGIKIDQTLTQDATGTLAYLQFEAMNVPKVQTDISVSYVDHNTLQTDNRNMDDHLYLQSVASKYGIYYSRPGNGICHQVHLERFARPGYTLLGSDSHTPTSGGIGMIAIGAGGLDAACAMAGEPFFLKVPKVINIKLTGKLKPWASAKDIILHILKIKSVKGGVGSIVEYSGDGLQYLSVPERAVITNMGAELGATTSVFPSDEITLDFMKRQGREHQYVEIKADEDATYDETLEIDLSSVVTYAAAPHSPDNVKKISDLSDVKVNQVSIGSCTNSSYRDLWIVGKILEGKVISKSVSLTISPGSKQVFSMISRDGTLTKLIDAGARILECACGPCIGMGQSPNSAGVSLRTFNRNFEGRSGTKDADIYLVSPEVAAISAINGFISDPMEHLGIMPEFKFPDEFVIDDRFIIPPAIEPNKVQIIRGPGIKPLPEQKPLPDTVEAKVIIKVGDNITTDHILPAGSKVLPYRSDIPKISEFAFGSIDPEFYKKALKEKIGVIVGGENYGQGSSREHAALAPKFLGIAAVIVKSFARIHKANLINFGIVPMTFENPSDYDAIKETDFVKIPNLKRDIMESDKVEAFVNDKKIILKIDLSNRDKQILLDGGTLANIKKKFSR